MFNRSSGSNSRSGCLSPLLPEESQSGRRKWTKLVTAERREFKPSVWAVRYDRVCVTDGSQTSADLVTVVLWANVR
ncbi:hypothetical protein OUZ56_020134 [Daphnia magna]|uniref:Uncharacterized protein n=1 Tax=Daphnia magna TaxID=35525 RepID=A0ABQ9ZDW1_9CRUS|nr:hypothetical protein OUZ56_020134 [Daphnia magna]